MEEEQTRHDFPSWLKALAPDLRRIAFRAARTNVFEDIDDTVAVMTAHLWRGWQSGFWRNKNRSYTLQSCYFHLQNHRRVMRETRTLSLETPIGEGDSPLSDILIDGRIWGDRQWSAWAIADGLRNNGLTLQEKAVVEWVIEGHTTREMGKKLNVSHVRVVKIQQSIRRKWGTKVDREMETLS